MPGYTQYTMASLVAEIASLIDDPEFIQWKYAEIRYGVIEALRYWGAITSYWRARGQFSAQAFQAWYDVAALLPDLRPRTTTLNDLVTEIDFHCCELPGGFSGAGLTTQFNIQSIITSIERGRNRFVMDAGLPLKISQQTITDPTSDGRYYVNEDIVYLRHGYWHDTVSGSWTPLRPTDAWAQDAYNPTWTVEQGLPAAFSQSVTRPVEVQLFPLPVNTGTIEWLSANSMNFTGATGATLLDIPDEFVHAVKYAALADLFSMDGESSDPQRSDYADRRYQQTVMVARNHKSVVRVLVNNIPVSMSALSMIDSAYPYWRTTVGKPANAGCDLDILALTPVPFNNGSGITVDVLRSAPIPATDAEFLQIGREAVPVIIDYVQHYLGFKLGGDEFFSSLPQYDGFVQAAKERNAIQSKQIKFMSPLYGIPGRENTLQMGETPDKAGTGPATGTQNRS